MSDGIAEGSGMDGPMRTVAEFGELAEGRGKRVEVDGEKILLVRDDDTVRAYAAECPHAGGPLEEGAVCDGRIVCPWHKGAFRVSDGALLEPPPLFALARYPVRVDELGAVFVSPRKIPPEPPPMAAQDARAMVIVGAGAAGSAAAAALREFGFGGTVTLIGREPGPPYDRTSLSKFVVSGEMPPGEVPSLLPPEFLAEQRIERIEAEAVRLDAHGKRVHLADNRSLPYNAALLAVGGTPKRLDMQGADLPGVHLLRDRPHAAAILASAPQGARAVILGASFIGLEVASGLRKRSVDVTVVSSEPVPFGKQFGPRLGAVFKELHEANGVTFRLGAQASRLEGSGRVEAAVLEDGTRLAADLVVAGVGVRPATGFVEGLELAKDGGIPVDAGMRAAADGLYAAGDVALFPLPGEAEPTRIEHWRVAQQHARVAARNMLGGTERYGGVPFFWTYHYGKRFDYLGHATEWDDVVVEGDTGEHVFVALLMKKGLVVGALGCQRERATAILSERLRAPPLLADEAMRLVRSAR
ncbi:MAG TPA: FAD-dependent oxidoreductase [Acetobacteraceae bacterium]|nr:FAD-dependent oxidoreductase [Acetobacteraceae bacterium]